MSCTYDPNAVAESADALDGEEGGDAPESGNTVDWTVLEEEDVDAGFSFAHDEGQNADSSSGGRIGMPLLSLVWLGYLVAIVG